jgi:hypothetical protein
VAEVMVEVADMTKVGTMITEVGTAVGIIRN